MAGMREKWEEREKTTSSSRYGRKPSKQTPTIECRGSTGDRQLGGRRGGRRREERQTTRKKGDRKETSLTMMTAKEVELNRPMSATAAAAAAEATGLSRVCLPTLFFPGRRRRKK